MKEDAKSRKDVLRDHLRVSILTLRLQPGTDLDESKLSEEFDLSRTPLREVLRQLAGQGYVDLRENRG
ncbi:GntR family transcriptional regulator, partial [Ruegeria sp. SCP11]|uniref:GntR family transcriptional regulator n=1 Tax=Ruegeria sp. SCP11 TaxID=3141378 RepID=UPI00333644F5